MERFTDPLDVAQMRAENETTYALAAHKERTSLLGLTPKGACHYCDSDVGQGELYCDEECQRDHVEEQRRIEWARKVKGG